jgi:uncharacterized protein (DUF1800 family)
MHRATLKAHATILLAALLAGCGSDAGDGTGTSTIGAQKTAAVDRVFAPAAVATLTTAQITHEEAFRFLSQATFGPTQADIDRLISLGDPAVAYGLWIDEQITTEPSLLLPYVQQAGQTIANPIVLNGYRQDAWFRNALHGPDQLRQRVAFALSEIMVVSQNGALLRAPFATSSYYDTLADGAFGNFRDLIEDVTLHPAMGVYLSMLGNRKPDPVRNIRPDENYARELMQLFTIGLYQLERDGPPKRDASGEKIPTYDQAVVEGFAHVFTGWTYAGASSFAAAKRTNANQVVPMQVYPEQHASGEKRLLVYPGVVKPVLPAGQTPQQDLADALDNVFHHPNVGPFISKALIRKLVTSNPTHGYIGRVAAVFNDDGTGTRGNLAAVVRAILLDEEARRAPANDRAGKVKEPLIRLTQLWRTYDARALNGRYDIPKLDVALGQAPLMAPSVFNFFTPTYAPAGEIADRSLVAPEQEIATEYVTTTTNNLFYDLVYNKNSTRPTGSSAVVIQVSEEAAVAHDPDALVALIARKLLGTAMSPSLESEVRATIARFPASNRSARVSEALYLVAVSPEFAAQR